ncbi:MAG: PhoH family protein [Planctomycetes bacterium]|nr:PhoH family protein [Planctomycetota bacterium]
MSEVTISLRNLDEERVLLGHLDRNLRVLRLAHGIEATSRGGRLTLKGEPEQVQRAAESVQRALEVIRNDSPDPSRVAEIFERDGDKPVEKGGSQNRLRIAVKPRSANQARYLEAMEASDVTFGVGPAGTGKTYLAVAMAVASVKAGHYRKIVLVRPAVEAGEHLGFLPGDLEAKIRPYLRPLYDALDDLLPKSTLKRYMEEGVVEISPLAYMRGRTLNHAVIILDEAQNTTVAQMKMFLTRMGSSSRIIVTGDVSQVDLPGGRESGLIHALRILRRVEGITICSLKQEDIVRHQVVQRIVKAYSSFEERGRQLEAERKKSDDDEGSPRGRERRRS